MSNLIRKVEQYLDAHIPNMKIRRHAAESVVFLSLWEVAEPVRVAALLVPLMRGKVFDDEWLINTFGSRPVQIARIAMRFGFQGVDIAHPTSQRDYAKKLRNLFVCAYIDVESAFVCVADRIAGASFVNEMSYEEYQAWAAETLAVDVPLLELLGMWEQRQNMANLALHLSDPPRYDEYEYYIRSYYDRYEADFDIIQQNLHEALEHHQISNAQIQMHETTPASVFVRHEKDAKRGMMFDRANVGSLRIDVIVKDEPSSYHAMGIIHNLWTPSASRPIRNEIASPRYNGYRALTTTVNCDIIQQPVEFRIITAEMAEVNAKGVLSRRKIKNAWWSDADLLVQIGIMETGRLDNDICVFTPIGELITLKQGSSVVDFAFRVHSKLGPFAQTFIVNGESVPYHHRLQHRDLVEIEYNRLYPSIQLEWAEAAETSIARSNIRRYFRESSDNIHKGRKLINEVLDRECLIYNMRFSHQQIEAGLKQAAEDLGCNTLEALYSSIAGGQIAPDSIVSGMIERELVAHIRLPDSLRQEVVNPRITLAKTWMTQPESHKFKPSMRVVPGKDIVGKLVGKGSKHPKLIVYRQDDPLAPSGEQAIQLEWGGGDLQREGAQIIVMGSAANNVAWAVLDALNVAARGIDDSNMLIVEMHTQITNGMHKLDLTLSTANATLFPAVEYRLTMLRNHQLIKSYKLWKLFPGKRVLVAGLSDRRHRNPYSPNFIQNSEMFYGRGRELNEIVRHIEGGGNFVILHGHKRIGKTSLMHHLATDTLPNALGDIIPVMVNAQEAAPFTEESFAEGLLFDAWDAIQPSIKRNEDRQTLEIGEQLTPANPLRDVVRWVKLAEQLTGKRLFFLIDEFTIAEEACTNGYIDESFFQRMDAIVDGGSLSMMLCIHNTVLRRPGSKLGNLQQRAKVIWVPELDERDAVALINQPVNQFYQYAQGVEDEIIQLTNRHPYYIHTLCNELITAASMRDNPLITKADLQKAVERVLHSAPIHFAHFQSAAADDTGWKILEAIARISGTNNLEWVEIERIKDVMFLVTEGVTSVDVHNRLMNIYNAGGIEKDSSTGKVRYRIAIGLFHKWLQPNVDTHAYRGIRQEAKI